MPRPGPVRTCIGCRRRAPAGELLRVVAAPVASGPPVVVPDPRHRLPGRGAWLHPDPGCVDAALKRRAFGRALRVPGTPDARAVLEWVTGAADGPTGGVQHHAPRSGKMEGSAWTSSGRPPE